MKKYQQQIIEVEASKKHRDWSENAWYLSGIWVVLDGILASFFGWNIAPAMEDISYCCVYVYLFGTNNFEFP